MATVPRARSLDARVAEIRRWRDQTLHIYGGGPTRRPEHVEHDAETARAWWRDVDTLLVALDNPATETGAHLPATLDLAGFRYEVSTDGDELARTGQRERANLLGHCDRQKQRILLDASGHPQIVAETLVHELLHALTQIAGLADEWSEDHEEEVVNRLAPLVALTIARNPDLVAVLRDVFGGDR